MEGKKSLAEKLNLSKGKLNRLLKKKGIINWYMSLVIFMVNFEHLFLN
jgi:hypothetical protein